MEKRLIVIKKATSHIGRKQNKKHILIRSNKKYKIKPPCIIDFRKNLPEKLMINFFGT